MTKVSFLKRFKLFYQESGKIPGKFKHVLKHINWLYVADNKAVWCTLCNVQLAGKIEVQDGKVIERTMDGGIVENNRT